MRRATGSTRQTYHRYEFLSTLSLRRATKLRNPIRPGKINFYPRSPCGERHFRSSIKRAITNFYPRSPCGERRDQTILKVYGYGISIHALLAESDIVYALIFANTMLFLSTLSLRRATCYSFRHSASCWHFYPRSPCGERLSYQHLSSDFRNFYPRSPCGERLKNAEAVSKYMIFLSTLSLRRATKLRNPIRPGKINFYPRSPCGERQLASILNSPNSQISIHALLAESDSVAPELRPTFLNFYPRSPCGERLPCF